MKFLSIYLLIGVLYSVFCIVMHKVVFHINVTVKGALAQLLTIPLWPLDFIVVIITSVIPTNKKKEFINGLLEEIDDLELYDEPLLK